LLEQRFLCRLHGAVGNCPVDRGIGIALGKTEIDFRRWPDETKQVRRFGLTAGGRYRNGGSRVSGAAGLSRSGIKSVAMQVFPDRSWICEKLARAGSEPLPPDDRHVRYGDDSDLTR